MIDDNLATMRTAPVRYDDDHLTRDEMPKSTIVSGPVIVHFEDIEDRLVEFILDSSAILGCVAWLTSEPVLRALQGRPVNLIVQKEDFLRPDPNPWKSNLRALYDDLVGFRESERFFWPEPVSRLSYLGDPTLGAVRCLGAHNAARKPAMPRMHHKFLVSGKWIDADIDDGRNDRGRSLSRFDARKVWTGSYNPTWNAKRSLENAVIIDDSNVAHRYVQEFLLLMRLTEPLDWETPWSEPEYRLGT